MLKSIPRNADGTIQVRELTDLLESTDHNDISKTFCQEDTEEILSFLSYYSCDAINLDEIIYEAQIALKDIFEIAIIFQDSHFNPNEWLKSINEIEKFELKTINDLSNYMIDLDIIKNKISCFKRERNENIRVVSEVIPKNCESKFSNTKSHINYGIKFNDLNFKLSSGISIDLVIFNIVSFFLKVLNNCAVDCDSIPLITILNELYKIIFNSISLEVRYSLSPEGLLANMQNRDSYLYECLEEYYNSDIT